MPWIRLPGNTKEKRGDMRKRGKNSEGLTKTQLKPIQDIARAVGINKKYLESTEISKTKVSPEILKSLKKHKKGKYVLVSSVTPTPFGEGKTLTTIGLSMAFKELKKKAISCIPQPSLSAIFGSKGIGTGGGASHVMPAEAANLYMTGDSSAVASAQNLCAAYLENSIFQDNPLDISPESITWKRVLDVNDRSLRNINTGLGGKADGIARKTGFELTASSELMSILALAEDLKDLRKRIGCIILGFTKKGKPVTCEDIKMAGAMTALLKEAQKPNLLQTTGQTACFMHTGSFANMSVGSSSVISDRIALGLADYVFTETGFGADMGAEKFFNIKCRTSGLKPDAAVLVCSVRALKMHSGDFDLTAARFPREILRENISAVERGFCNLEKQIENIRTFGVPVIVCINRFTDDTEKEVEAIKRRAKDLGANGVAVSDMWASGGRGGLELARCIIDACKQKNSFRFLYPLDLTIKEKIRRIAKSIYGAKEVVFSEEVDKKTAQFGKLKLSDLPVCIVKTSRSLSYNPKRKGRPHGFKFPVEDLQILKGAGYITAFSTNIKTIPSLPKIPRGTKIDVAEDGKITGLF